VKPSGFGGAEEGEGRFKVDRRSLLTGLAAVGAFLVVDLGAVAYANNWIRPAGAFTRQTIIDALRATYGVHPGFRKNHAKGVAVTGFFDSNGNGAALSTAEVFTRRRTPVVGRFSLAGGDPAIEDSLTAARGLGLAFGLTGAQQWRTAMLNLPVFPDNSAHGFYERILASKVVPGTGKPDPAAMERFLAAHPETAAAMAVIKAHPPTPGFADSTFSGLNTFLFTDRAKRVTPVRWSLVPEQAALPARPGRDGLFDALVRQLRSTPLRWRMEIVVGESATRSMTQHCRGPLSAGASMSAP
jgi:catalase